jgi:photosystem II stability/assembly factor-like uncharacterized protein
MQTKTMVGWLGWLAMVAAAPGCKKNTGTGTGGGGGSWLVGASGLMANVDGRGALGDGYDLGATETLYGIACRDQGEAWVVGEHGTVLYTDDGGASWTNQVVPTTAALRAVATAELAATAPVFVVGDGAFLTTADGGARGTALGDGQARFRSISAASRGGTVLALADGGDVWAYADGALTRVARLPAARAITVAVDGTAAFAVGDGAWRSDDGGHTWVAIAAAAGAHLDEAWAGTAAHAIAVGRGGAIVALDGAAVTAQTVGAADLHTVRIGADGAGVAAGDGGQLLLTDDAGAHWRLGPSVGRTVWSTDELGAGHR